MPDRGQLSRNIGAVVGCIEIKTTSAIELALQTVKTSAVRKNINMPPRASTMQLSMRVLRTASEIEQLREAWRQLDTVRDVDMDFYLFIVELFPQAKRPHVIAIYENE